MLAFPQISKTNHQYYEWLNVENVLKLSLAK